jgi:hypothetical protein
MILSKQCLPPSTHSQPILLPDNTAATLTHSHILTQTHTHTHREREREKERERCVAWLLHMVRSSRLVCFASFADLSCAYLASVGLIASSLSSAFSILGVGGWVGSGRVHTFVIYIAVLLFAHNRTHMGILTMVMLIMTSTTYLRNSSTFKPVSSSAMTLLIVNGRCM